MNTQSYTRDHETAYYRLGDEYTCRPDERAATRSPNRRWLLGTGAAVAVGGAALAAALMGATSGTPAAPVAPSAPATSAPVNPAVPSTPPVNPAVPTRPAANPAVPGVPAGAPDSQHGSAPVGS